MHRIATAFALTVALAAGCYIEPEVEYPYVAGPDLVYVEPGLEVVAGYDFPVFFVDGAYWLWWGGFWYTSPYWNHGWRRDRVVPPRIRAIDRPERYAHVQPSPSYAMRRAPGYTTRPTPGYGAHPTRFVPPTQHVGGTQHGGHR